jgi:hypothetical protein
MVTEPSSSPNAGEDPPPAVLRSPATSTALRTPLARPPILASEVLREDVAPLEPARSALRNWLLALALGLACAGALMRAGMVQAPLWAELYAYGAAATLGISLFLPYRARGILAIAIGIATVGLGLAGKGPLSGLVAPQDFFGAEVSRFLAATALPAALLFRARYRAYRGARIALIVALVFAVPATVHAGLDVASGPWVAQLTACLTIASVLASFMGFMGSGTTGASTAWAVAVVVSFGLDVMARALWMDGGIGTNIGQIHVGFVFTLACAMTAIGLFKLLASILAADARRLDVLGAEAESEPMAESSEGSD